MLFFCKVFSTHEIWKWRCVFASSHRQCLRKLLGRNDYCSQAFSVGDIFEKIFKRLDLPPIQEKHWLIFFEKLRAQLSTSISLINALRQMADMPFNHSLQYFIAKAIDRLSNGFYMYPLLSDPRLNLGQQSIKLLQSAEVGGYLPQALERLIELMHLQQKIRKQMLQSLIYPTCVLVTIVVFLLLMSSFLLPQFEAFFIQQSIPINDFLSFLFHSNRHLGKVFMIAGVGFGGLYLWMKTKKISVQNGLNRLLSHWFPSFKYTLFAMNLAELLENKIPLLECLTLAAENLPKKFSVDKMSVALSNGIRLSMALEDLPEDFSHVLQTSEVDNRLIQNLRQLSADYYKRYENQLLGLSKWLEPVSILLMALILFLAVACLFYPLLQVFQSMKFEL